MPDPSYGDLVKITIFPGDYYAIVVKLNRERRMCRVFAGNGLTAEFRFDQVEAIPLNHESDSPHNFAEILKQPREFVHPRSTS